MTQVRIFANRVDDTTTKVTAYVAQTSPINLVPESNIQLLPAQPADGGAFVFDKVNASFSSRVVQQPLHVFQAGSVMAVRDEKVHHVHRQTVAVSPRIIFKSDASHFVSLYSRRPQGTSGRCRLSETTLQPYPI